MPPDSHDRDHAHTDQASIRQWINQLADEYGVDVDDLLIQSRRRDPMYKGTDADHAKAEWFGRLWRKAVEKRESDRIHVRGVHYTVYMDDMDVEPPTDCSWASYDNTQKCYDYLEECAVLARILGYIPLDGIIDKRADTRTITEYGDHTVRPDPRGFPLRPGFRRRQSLIQRLRPDSSSILTRQRTRSGLPNASRHVHAKTCRSTKPGSRRIISNSGARRRSPITSAAGAGWPPSMAATSSSRVRATSR